MNLETSYGVKRKNIAKIVINCQKNGRVSWKQIQKRKKQVMKKRDELEQKYFGNKGDNPNN